MKIQLEFRKEISNYPALKEGNNNGYHDYVVRWARISHLIKGLPNFKFLQANKCVLFLFSELHILVFFSGTDYFIWEYLQNTCTFS